MIDIRKFDQHLYGKPTTSENPKVSVCFITFNHASYLREALDSIVSQKTDFEFEIVIGDDCSTDGTTDIVKEFAHKYPHLIRAYIRPENLTKYGLPGKFNFVHAFSVCKGEYLVHFEGDDYLTDSSKLQTQKDFLDTHKQYSACFHNALMKFEDHSGRQDYEINGPHQKKEIQPLDLLKEQEIWFMATASVMFRKQIIGHQFPEWFLKSKSGDIPLYVMLSYHSPIAYIDQLMMVYRRHHSGLSYTDSNFDLSFLLNRIYMYDQIGIHTKGDFAQEIKNIKIEYYEMIFNTHQVINSQANRLKYLLKLFSLRLPKINEIKDIITGKLLTPRNLQKLYKVIRFMKK